MGRPVGEHHYKRGPYLGCWEWTGSKLAFGYGRVWWNGKLNLVHRLVYEALVEDIPKGLFVLHHCDNPPCFNPNHLYVGTDQDNSNDRVSRGRQVNYTYERTEEHRIKMSVARKGIKSTKNGKTMSGENHPRVKLTDRQVFEIRKSKLSNAELSRRYNVSWTHISRIKQGFRGDDGTTDT